jgi:hypothetical protein
VRRVRNLAVELVSRAAGRNQVDIH